MAAGRSISAPRRINTPTKIGTSWRNCGGVFGLPWLTRAFSGLKQTALAKHWGPRCCWHSDKIVFAASGVLSFTAFWNVWCARAPKKRWVWIWRARSCCCRRPPQGSGVSPNAGNSGSVSPCEDKTLPWNNIDCKLVFFGLNGFLKRELRTRTGGGGGSPKPGSKW